MTAAGTDHRHLIPIAGAPEFRRCRNCGDVIDLSVSAARLETSTS